MMERQEQQSHHVKRVVLPSGKTIDVLYFSDGPSETGRKVGTGTKTGLHICPECSSGLVYPLQWEEAGPENWHVALRCPNCEWSADGVYPQGMVDDFDEELERGTDELVGDLKQLMRANMAEEVDRFAAALDADFILPEDF
jgi:hypothetical protein